MQCDSDEYGKRDVPDSRCSRTFGQNVQEIVSLEDGKYYNCRQTALTAGGKLEDLCMLGLEQRKKQGKNTKSRNLYKSEKKSYGNVPKIKDIICGCR